MKRLILLIALVVLVMMLAGLPASAVPDTDASLADTGIPDNEVSSIVSKASNSSASATITITMYTAAD